MSLSTRPTPPFVGREAELALLQEAHAQTRAGGPGGRLALLSGDAGVGKSQLLREFGGYLRGQGERLLEGRCTPGIDRAYQPFAELLAAGLASLEALGVDAPSVERYVEHLGPLLPSRRAPRGAASKWPLYDAVLEFLQSLGRLAPHTFLVHDLHHADPATLELLRFLAENLATPEALRARDGSEGGTFLVVSSRPRGPAGALFDELGRLPWATRVSLGGLGREDVARLLQSAPVVERLYQRTGGNPHHLEELLASLPADVEDLFLQRALRLPAAARGCLAALAVLGRPAEASTVARLALLEEPRAEAALAELATARLVTRGLDGGRVRYAFAKELHQEHYYGALEETERRTLHGRAGLLLEAQGESPELLAHHLLRAGEARGARHALAAARALRRAHAHGEGARLLEQALSALERDALGEDTTRLREEALSELAELHRLRGEYGAALRALGRLLQGQHPSARAPALRRAGQLLTQKGSTAAAQRLLRRALALCEASGDGREGLEVRAALAETHYLRGEYADAEGLCAAGLGQGAQGHDDTEGHRDLAPRCRVALRNVLGKVRLQQERHDEALRAFDGNLALTRAQRRRREEEPGEEPEHGEALDLDEAAALNNLGIVHLRRGEYERALHAYTLALERFEALHEPAGRAFCQQNLGVLFHERGDYGRALHAYHEGLVGFRRVGNQTQLTNTAINLGNLYLVLGDLTRAERLVSFALDRAVELSAPLLAAYGHSLLGEVLCAQGRHDAARVYLERAVSRFEEVGNRRLASEVRLHLARLWLATANPDKAEAALRRVEALVLDEELPKVAGQASLVRAELLLAADPTRAAEAFERARALFESDRDEEGTWRAREGLGRALTALGRALEAENHLLKAQSLIDALAARVPDDLRDTYLAEPRRVAVAAALTALAHGATSPRRGLRAEPDGRRAEPLFRAAARELAAVRGEFAGRHPGGPYARLVGQSRPLLALLRLVDKVAPAATTVLLRGESGTGKELVAEALHRRSPRAHAPFVTVNCAALVETLLLSELFGHEKGAFTGAVARKRGRFELADGGTLFLDEIGDISPRTQVALLRVLQERQFERVGGTNPVKVNVRIVCATHRDLEALVRAGQFREDLYFRLKGVVLELPPLRARRDDIPLLAAHFLAQAAREGGDADTGAPPRHLDDEAMELLLGHDWPGNVRELENVVRSAALLAEGPVITRADLAPLGPPQRSPRIDPPRLSPPGDTPEEAVIERVLREEVGLAEMKKHLELECIRRALQRSGGNITHAAKLLQMKRPRLSQIVKEHAEALRLERLPTDPTDDAAQGLGDER